jgi:phage-related protein
MPPEVRRTMGYALRVAQEGGRAEHASRMLGDLRDVFEVAANDDTGKSTFRVFYTTAIGDIVFVLDAIQKKSKKGRSTPQADLDRLRQRLRSAREYDDTEDPKA